MRTTARRRRWRIALAVCIVLVWGAVGWAQPEQPAVTQSNHSTDAVDTPPAGEQEALDAGDDVDRYVRRHASEDYAGSYLKQEGATTVLWSASQGMQASTSATSWPDPRTPGGSASSRPGIPSGSSRPWPTGSRTTSMTWNVLG